MFIFLFFNWQFMIILNHRYKNITIYFFYFRDGRSRCGIYCAANACIEQVIQHGEVDVFQAVRTVRRHRPQLIENIVSYCSKHRRYKNMSKTFMTVPPF